MSPDSELLMKAILAGPSEAETQWRRWRAETDLDGMSEDCVRLLPVLVARSSSWLTGDPAKNLILGICKRAWTRNQVLLRSLAELAASLAAAGVEPVAVAGPPAWALLHQSAKSFRPIGFLELLIPRGEALPAASALAALGWNRGPGAVALEPEALDHVAGIWLRRETGEGLRLTWRLFPAPPEFAAQWESLPPFETVDFQGATFTLPPKEAMLSCALAGSREGDHLDWRCDALLLLRGGTIDWSLVKKWVRFSPEARRKLSCLARETDVPIPTTARREPMRLRSQWDLVWSEYRWRAESRRETRSLRGFLNFLCERWQAPAWQLPIFGLVYMVRYTFPGRAGSEP